MRLKGSGLGKGLVAEISRRVKTGLLEKVSKTPEGDKGVMKQISGG